MSENKKNLKEILESMNGQEVWTEAFGEKECVMIEGENYWVNGIKKKIPQNKILVLQEDMFRQEFGYGSDSPRFLKELEKEFGPIKVNE